MTAGRRAGRLCAAAPAVRGRSERDATPRNPRTGSAARVSRGTAPRRVLADPPDWMGREMRHVGSAKEQTMMNRMIMAAVAGVMAVATLQSAAALAKDGPKTQVHRFDNGPKMQDHKFDKPHKWHRWRDFTLVRVPAYDCSYLYWKWKHTGSPFWYDQYRHCIAY
jgi:hypothetical protein